MTTRLKKIYEKEVVPKLMEQFKYKNKHEVPKIKKVSLNCVTKDVVAESKTLDKVLNVLALIAGQKPMVAKAKKAIASFKVRLNQPLGGFVTLRSDRMYDFIDRFVHFTLPRVKDFRGLEPKSFDGVGNYNLGIKEQIIFPEIHYDSIDKIRGLGLSIETTAKTNEEALALLTYLGFPFKTQEKK